MAAVVARELVIYADESEKDGTHYGNFYGGVAVWSSDLNESIRRLSQLKANLNLNSEMKWQKVTPLYLDRYCQFVDEFFNLMDEGKVRTRIMFTHKYQVPTNLGRYHRQNEYHILYYQVLKHAFGLEHAHDGVTPLRVRLYLDKLPDTDARNAAFKGYVRGLEHHPPFRAKRIRFPEDQMAEVYSKNHVLLQGLDVVLGAIQFRLNDKHLAKADGAELRGKKTIAKERLYKQINARIRRLYPGFNIGVSTGRSSGVSDLWTHAYRHWRFQPSNYVTDSSKAKPRNR